MRKWTKGILIFGVVTTIIGFIMMVVGVQSNGMQALLTMSEHPVYDSRVEELTFGDEVEKIDVTLDQHSLTIMESHDDKIHIQYHPSISKGHDLTSGTSDKTLSVTDKKLSQQRFLGSGIEGLLHIASSYSRRFDEVFLYLPKGRSLKSITISANRGQTNIYRANLENATIQSNGYLLRIKDSRIKNSNITTADIINIFDTEFTDSQVTSTSYHIHVEGIQVHGKVEFEAQSSIHFMLTKEERQRINFDLSTKHGSIIQFVRKEQRPIKEEDDNQYERLASSYKTAKTDVKDQLIARADGDISLPEDEDVPAPSRNR